MKAWMQRKINDRNRTIENGTSVHALIDTSYTLMQQVKGAFTQFGFLHGSKDDVIEACADVAASMVAIAEALDED